MGEVIFTLLLAFVLMFIGGGFGLSSKTELYKTNYINALNNRDRIQAIHWGRLYYSKMSANGSLRQIDEISIQNDILVYIG